jgi:hypothetical protein
MKVNFIVTCHNREEYLDGLKDVLAHYYKIEPTMILCYNGNDPSFPADIRLQNTGHQKGDYDLTIAGYRKIRDNLCPRFIKIGIDSWLLDEDKIISIFDKMATINAAVGTSHWFVNHQRPDHSYATDIMFMDTRMGEVLGKINPPGCFEAELWNAVKENNLNAYVIPERNPGDGPCRWSCPALGWTMEHNLQKNIAFAKRWREERSKIT